MHVLNSANLTILIYFIFVSEKPTLQVQPVNVEIGRGQTAKFHCSVTGGKNLHIGWYYGKEYFDQKTTGGNGIKVDSSNDLILSNVDVANPQTVWCVFRDDLTQRQQHSARVSLKVIGMLLKSCILIYFTFESGFSLNCPLFHIS